VGEKEGKKRARTFAFCETTLPKDCENSGQKERIKRKGGLPKKEKGGVEKYLSPHRACHPSGTTKERKRRKKEGREGKAASQFLPLQHCSSYYGRGRGGGGGGARRKEGKGEKRRGTGTFRFSVPITVVFYLSQKKKGKSR